MKRLLLFASLLACGLFALKFAIGDEVAVRTEGDQATRSERDPKQDQAPGVRVDNGKLHTTISQSGKLVFPRKREVDLGGGRVRKETLFILRAEDSQPVGDGLQQLTDVRLELFDDDQHAGTVTATRAFLELGRDANGQPRIDERKAIDLRDTVITGEPGGRLTGLRLDLGDAKVNVGDDEIQLTTAADQPVSMRFEGDRAATLIGRGARTRLPRSKHSSLQQASVTILSAPRLETADVKVQAAGRMHYVEDMVTGAARITLEDEVMLDLERGGLAMTGTTSRGRSSARGDQFTGWISRQRAAGSRSSAEGDRQPSMSWQRIVLAGAPASIEVPGVQVETPRITGRPGPLGDPNVVTAHGGASRIEQQEAGSDRLVGVSPRQIHMIRPGDSAGAMHRAVGFPQWTTRALQQQQLVVFMDRSRIEQGARAVVASEGMMIARRLDAETSVVQGFGRIEVSEDGAVRPALRATGSDGVLLTVTGQEERVQLGPSDEVGGAAWRRHRYEVRYGQATLQGTGSCSVARASGVTHLALRAPHDQIAASFGAEETELRRVRRLRAKLVGERVADLDVYGLPVQAAFTRAAERLRAQAPRIRQLGARSIQLLEVDVDESPWNELGASDRTPQLTRTWATSGEDDADYQIDVRGARVDVHHSGGRTVIVDTHADEDQAAHIYAVLPQPDSAEPSTVACAASRLRVLPFVVTPEATALHFGGGGALPAIATHALGKPWLLVDDVRRFEMDDQQQGHVEGSGHKLLISQGGAAALFLGDPDAQTPAVVRRNQDGRDVVVRGARVRLRRAADLQLSAFGTFEDRSTLLPPTMTLHEAGGSGLLAHMEAVCRGDIHIDPDAVRFTGPVEAVSLMPDGAIDPQGMNIDARQLEMKRQPATGRVASVEGEDVSVDWPRLGAKAGRVQLDLLRETCVASDSKAAVITMPDGRELRSTRISVNYLTWEISTGPSSARRTPPVAEAAGEGLQ
ncbi:MAG: hypothetical protein VXY92_07180 [Planctomycetota bacterium]|nr:hypothetical protein [Planctomycetota bacterium]